MWIIYGPIIPNVYVSVCCISAEERIIFTESCLCPDEIKTPHSDAAVRRQVFMLLKHTLNVQSCSLMSLEATDGFIVDVFLVF